MEIWRISAENFVIWWFIGESLYFNETLLQVLILRNNTVVFRRIKTCDCIVLYFSSPFAPKFVSGLQRFGIK